MVHNDMFDDENDHLDKDDKDYEPSKDKIYDFIPKGMIKRKTFEGERPGLKLRACIRCRLIMTEDQFYENGCGNCTHLQMDGDRRRTLDCTSSNFSGFLSVMDPEKSWSGKYNNLEEGKNMTNIECVHFKWLPLPVVDLTQKFSPN